MSSHARRGSADLRSLPRPESTKLEAKIDQIVQVRRLSNHRRDRTELMRIEGIAYLLESGSDHLAGSLDAL